MNLQTSIFIQTVFERGEILDLFKKQLSSAAT